jgi:hypothetical protein
VKKVYKSTLRYKILVYSFIPALLWKLIISDPNLLSIQMKEAGRQENSPNLTQVFLEIFLYFFGYELMVPYFAQLND